MDVDEDSSDVESVADVIDSIKENPVKVDSMKNAKEESKETEDGCLIDEKIHEVKQI